MKNKIVSTSIIKKFSLSFAFLFFVFSFALNVKVVLAVDTTAPTVNMTYGANPAGVGTNTITARYSESIASNPTISINQQGSTDITNAAMTAPATTWTGRSASEANTWRSVTYGNGIFVAVAINGTNRVMTSSDGITWTARTAAEANNWNYVTFGNGLFVAVAGTGTNRVMTSPDGITWTARTAAAQNSWGNVTYGNGLFVATSYDGTVSDAVMTSPNGINWTARSVPEANAWYGVTYGNGTFVSVAGNGTNRVLTSTDGINWSVNNPPESNSWRSVTYGNGQFVMVGVTGTSRVMTSPDGITWTARTASSGRSWINVTYGDGVYVAVAYDGVIGDCIMTSRDGITWVAKTSSEGITWMNITYGNGKFVAVSSDGTNRVMTATSGYTYDYTVNQANGSTYVDGLATVSLSSVNDLAGNASTGPVNNLFNIDTTPANATLSYSSNPVKVGTQTVTATFSDAITSAPTISINQPGSTDITNASMTPIAPGTNWTARTAAEANQWRAVAYGNGTFVAVAITGSNRVMTSPDGITWTARAAAQANSWYSVTYGNGLFVAVAIDGTNRVMTSPDGITWTARLASEANSWNSVTYGNGMFVAVSGDGTNRVMTSPDGITWTARTASEANTWQSVTYGNGLFVAVTYNGTNRVMTSGDGITWTARTASSASAWVAVTYGNGLFVAVSSYSGTVMTSTNGINWVTQTAAEANDWISVAYSNGIFVAVSDTGTNRIMTSPDGVTWTARAASEANGWRSVTYGKGILVAVSNSGTNRVMTSPAFSYSYNYTVNQADGSTYVDGTATVSLSSTTDLLGNTPSTISNNTFTIDTTNPTIALSYSRNPAGVGVNTITTNYSEPISSAPTISINQQGSTDITNASMVTPGSVWTARSASEANGWRSVAYGNGTFVAISTGGTNRVMTSTDGITWTARAASHIMSWYSVTYGNGLFVAVSNGGGAGQRVMTSNNGIDWIARTEAEGNPWYSVTYGNGLFVAVAGSGTNRVMTSTNGINWSTQTAAEANTWRSVAYGNGLFVAVSNDGTNRVMTSTNGTTWTSRSTIYEQNTWNAVTYGNGLFVAVSSSGNNRVMTSPDGITWTPRVQAESNNWQNVTYGNGLFVASAVSGTNQIMTSQNGITWTSRSAIQANQWYGLAYGNGIFVAVSIDGINQIMTSPANYYYNYTVNSANGSTYVDGPATVSLSSVNDIAGNTASAPTNATFNIDTTGPSVALSYSKNPAGVGTNTITATYSKAIVGTPTISIDQQGSTDISNTSMTTGTQVTNWSKQNPSEANSWKSVTYGNGLYVAVSNDGTNQIMTSPDGVTWTARSSPISNPWISVAYGNGIFVAIPSNNSSYGIYSSNGISWNQMAIPYNALNSWKYVTYGNNKFVAVGSGGQYVMTSTDGTNWYGRTPAQNNSWRSVTYGNGLFVAVSSTGTNRIMTSPDGIDWMTRTAPVSPWMSIAYGNGTFVAVSSSQVTEVMTSSNGIDWTLRTGNGNGSWRSVAYGDGYFIAVTNANADMGTNVMYSTDGVTWSSVQVNCPDSEWSSIIYGGGRFVAVADYGLNQVIFSLPKYLYSYTVNQANGSTYIDGDATVSLSTTSDIAGNTSQNPTNTTFIIDTVAPTASITYSPNRPVKSGDSLVITVTFSEPMADAPLPKIALSGVATLSATDMTKVDTTHYTYTYTVGAGNGIATIALSTGTDIGGNIIVSAPTSGATFTVDNIVPTGTITSICSTAGNACTTVGQNANPQESYMVSSIAGTAQDEVSGSGLSVINISIKDTTTNLWYNGTSFGDASENYQTATGTTTWSYNTSSAPLVIDHVYNVNIKINDASLNNLIIPLSFKFTNSPPVVSNVLITDNTNGQITLTYDVTDIESAQTTNSLFYGIGATLNGDINSAVTSLTVSSDTYLPASGSIMIDDEIISYTSKASNVLSGLSRGALSTTAISHTTGANIFVKANTVSGSGIGASNKGTGKTIVWNAKTDADGYESASAVIKVVANDGSTGSMIGSLASSTFTLDVKSPTEIISFDAGIAGQAGSATITIPIPTDISPVYYKISDDADSQTDPTTTDWVLMSTSTSIPWSFDSGIEVKTLKYQWKDDKGNISAEQTVSTHMPVSSGSFMVQDTSNISATPPYYDLYIGWQATEVTGFASYKLEYATATDNTNYGSYTSIVSASFSDVNTNYYVYRNLDSSLFYRFRLSVVDTNGNISVRSNSFTTAKPDGVQNYGEGGGGSVLTASKVENVVVTQNEDKTVGVTYKLTDGSISKKVSPSYEAHLFYNIGITLPSNSLTGNTLTISDASKLKSSGYIQVNNEVLKYTGKTGNNLTGIVRGTWPTDVSSGRATRSNPSMLAGTPVWIMANGTTPISITNTSITTGQSGTITWNTYEESALAGYAYPNTDIKVLVHDNQDSLSGPLSSQNDYSENGSLSNLDLTAPAISFSGTSSSGNESVTPVTLTLNLARAYPLPVSVNYTLSGTATSADYTLTNGVATISAGLTSTTISIPIINDEFKEIDNTIIVTIDNPTNAILGVNSVYTYTILNDDTTVDVASLSTIGFSAVTSESDENISDVNIPVTISAPYEQDVKVDYAVVGGTAEGSSVDFLLADGTLTIPTGQTTGNIHITVFDDNVAELTETIALQLSNPLNAVLSANINHIYSILDNEIAVTSISGSNVKATSARITWTTADFTDSLVEYGTAVPGTDGAYNLSKINSDEVLEHNVYLGNLTPSTKYYFRTTSVNLAGEETVSESDFTTTAGPVITNVNISAITDTGATIMWTTDIPASSYVSYSLNSDLSASSRTGTIDPVTAHSVTLTNLNSLSKYYLLVDGTDGNGNIGENANDGAYYNFTTGEDQTAPVISDISTPIITSTQVAIVWKTSEPASGKIKYGLTQGTYSNETELISTPLTSHLVAIDGLTPETEYYYVIESSDSLNNTRTTEEQNFTTTAASATVVHGGGNIGVAQELYDLILAENQNYKAKFGSDTTTPIVSNIEVNDITAFGATISFSSDIETIAFIDYGKSEGYGSVIADKDWKKTHNIKLTGLSLGSKYSFKISAMNRANDIGYSDNETFTTKFLTENLAELKNIDNIEQFQKEIEATIESILPSLVPPFIDSPVISDIKEDGATITFRTNIKTYPAVSYIADVNYDKTKENPYDGQISDTSTKDTSHKMTLTGLKSNTKYHFMAKAFSLPQVVGSSEDMTFITAASKIHGSIIDVKKDSFSVVWTTDEPTSSIVEYKNVKTGRISRIVDSVLNSSHSIKAESLSPDTLYEVSISGVNAKGNLVQGSDSLSVKTSIDITAPSISNLKVDSSLITGQNDKAQTIISWQTDEPSTSTVFYEEGVGSSTKPLSNKQENLELTKNHVVILTSLKAGTIYRFTVNSTDDANNITKSPIRTIITPKKTESIVDIIFKNFDETFNFINNVK